MISLKKSLAVLLSFFLSTTFAVISDFEIIYKTDNFVMDQSQIKTAVKGALDFAHLLSGYSNAFVFACSKQDGAENYLIVRLFRGYSGKAYRLDIVDYKVTKVTEDYVEEAPVSPDYCVTCPDPSVEVLISYSTEQGGTAIQPCKDVINALKNTGIKHAVLVDNEENKTSVLNYLSCPKLKVWGRIGHALQGSLGLGTEKNIEDLTTRDIQRSPFKEVIKTRFSKNTGTGKYLAIIKNKSESISKVFTVTK